MPSNINEADEIEKAPFQHHRPRPGVETITVRWTETWEYTIAVKLGTKPKRGRDLRPQELIVFGSSIDEGIVGVAQPQIPIEKEIWEIAKQLPSVKSYLDQKKLIEYRFAA